MTARLFALFTSLEYNCADKDKKMYTRVLSAPPDKIIKDGVPVFGSFTHGPDRLDISDITNRFHDLPLLPVFSNFRIRANITFSFITNDYIGVVELLDVKYYCFSEIILWNRKTGKRHSYRSVFGMRRFLSKNLNKATCSTYRQNRYIRVSWDRKKQRLSLYFNMKGDSTKPSFTGAFLIKTDSSGYAELFSVTPAPTKKRCAASLCGAGALKGSLTNITTGSLHKCREEDCSGLFIYRRAYYRLRSKLEELTATGTLNGQKISFHIAASSISATDSASYNENVLYTDNKITPLPPVTITHPFGIEGKWIIQDTESMIDLFFEPVSVNHRIDSMLILRSDYHIMYGMFSGDLKQEDGTVIHLKDFPGIVRKQSLRM